ncbi:dihydrofolate reductase family protein [Stackebrandtia nassauensis]|uniref:Bifunctional deaminase-reductase domain protein n=1 Tax=Stackebrandtia nassauensis (strain DSM 44728 / CIP 108903 / NRRL B-16338 / NBRC 102104 / LLR-40K-21) TaxID=446470 RepID=D3PWL1_STANL|nr:dihydrofolate reductase family protein [Stackebrandtia nassauensis]ADD43233.1 bifunctional deaminase-reductase domain protein [Stackebrandtia nassauensis DSM 44728]
MNTVIFDISMSLDGYISAANRTADEPNGEGSHVLHDWVFADGDPANEALVASGWDNIGAVIAGRATYDLSVPYWQADGPSGPARRPVIVVTHNAPRHSPEDGVYEFVTDGIEAALARATAVAGNGDVTVMGGAALGRQFIEAGLLDEISLHVAPVLFGDGTRLFETMKIDHTRLQVRDVINTPAATHLRYRVLKAHV